ncbi:hypothetical protein BMS3Abin16_01533 [archaeon BMS3Abin16]|nr:hypothetical protein BMS3Abin16_01533 [archaeon BMS3Abin16]
MAVSAISINFLYGININIYVGDSMYVRTTIKLREDIYQRLKKEVGARGMSEKINKILEETLIKKKKTLYGTMPKVDTGDLRDHEDRM